jgi:hypothetical protein
MAVSVFTDKLVQPSEKMMSESLCKSYKYYLKIKHGLETEYGVLIEEWKFYGQKSGWILKFLRKKRNLFFLNPQENFFNVSFVFGDKAVLAIDQNVFPQTIKNELKEARKYAEGRGLTIKVTSYTDVENILKLVRIKLKN